MAILEKIFENIFDFFENLSFVDIFFTVIILGIIISIIDAIKGAVKKHVYKKYSFFKPPCMNIPLSCYPKSQRYMECKNRKALREYKKECWKRFFGL